MASLPITLRQDIIVLFSLSLITPPPHFHTGFEIVAKAQDMSATKDPESAFKAVDEEDGDSRYPNIRFTTATEPFVMDVPGRRERDRDAPLIDAERPLGSMSRPTIVEPAKGTDILEKQVEPTIDRLNHPDLKSFTQFCDPDYRLHHPELLFDCIADDGTKYDGEAMYQVIDSLQRYNVLSTRAQLFQIQLQNSTDACRSGTVEFA